MRHGLVVAGLLGELEQALHQRLMVRLVAQLVDVAQERRARFRPGIREPPGGQGAEQGGVAAASQLVEQPLVARFEELLEERRRVRHGG